MKIQFENINVPESQSHTPRALTDLPPQFQVAFAEMIQAPPKAVRKDLSADVVWAIFHAEHLHSGGALRFLDSYRQWTDGEHVMISAYLEVNGHVRQVFGYGRELIDAYISALNYTFQTEITLIQYEERRVRQGDTLPSIVHAELSDSNGVIALGVSVHVDASIATLYAATRAFERLLPTCGGHPRSPGLMGYDGIGPR